MEYQRNTNAMEDNEFGGLLVGYQLYKETPAKEITND